jgi:hypothetical protein
MNDNSFENIEIRPDIFPSKWHYKNLNPEDFEWITGGINRASRLTTKSRLNSSYRKKTSLDKLIESYSDGWNYGDQMIICVWDAHLIKKKVNRVSVSFPLILLGTKPQLRK